MRLIHHVLPFSIQQPIVSYSQLVIVLELLQHSLRPGVRARAPLTRIKSVLRGADVDIVDSAARKDRVQDCLEEGWLSCSWQRIVDTLSLLSKSLPLGNNGIRFLIIDKAVGAGVDKFVLSLGDQQAVRLENISSLLRDTSTKFSGSPQCTPARGTVYIPELNVIGQVEEVGDWNFLARLVSAWPVSSRKGYQRFDVADIHNPEVSCPSFIRQVHLLPGVLQLDRVDLGSVSTCPAFHF